jgi:hypothetical protein
MEPFLPIQSLEAFHERHSIESLPPVPPPVPPPPPGPEQTRFGDYIYTQGLNSPPQGDKTAALLASIDENTTVTLTSSTVSSAAVSLRQLGQHCDTVYSLIASNETFGKAPVTEIDLHQFAVDPINQFIALLESHPSFDSSVIAPDCLVEVCQVAHFLQSHQALAFVVSLILPSIDQTNCASLLGLADALDLPVVFEACMSQLTQSLTGVERLEGFNDLPGDLRKKAKLFHGAVNSSILNRGGRARAFFGNASEFLAIIRETLQDQNERLEEAKERQAEIIAERAEDEPDGLAHLPNAFDAAQDSDMIDAQKKIDRQESRIRTLEKFFADQRTLFEGLDEEFRL